DDDAGPLPSPPMLPWLTITLRPTESTRAERCPRSSKELLHPFTPFIWYAPAIRHLLDGHSGNVDHGWCHHLRHLRKSIRWRGAHREGHRRRRRRSRTRRLGRG